jgi:hypothetical protein
MRRPHPRLQLPSTSWPPTSRRCRNRSWHLQMQPEPHQRQCSFPPSSTSPLLETSKEEATVAVDGVNKDVGIVEAGKAKAEDATCASWLQTKLHARQVEAFLPSPPSRRQECHSWEQVLQMHPTPTSLNGMPT